MISKRKRVLGSVVGALIVGVLATACTDSDGITIFEGPIPTPPAAADLAIGAANYERVVYVASNGDDERDGFSVETAVASIVHALEIVGPGEAVFVLPGEYHENIELYEAGSDEAPISIVGAGEGVVLDGRRELPIGVWCEVCSNFVVENLEIRNFTDIGIGFSQSQSIRLSNLVVHDNGFAVQRVSWEIEGYGIHVEDSRAVVVDGNDVYQNGPNPQTDGFLMGTGINTFACSACVIRRNRSHDNIGGGILSEDSVNVLLEDNEIFGNNLDASIEEWWDGGIWIDGGQDIVVRGNVIRDNLGPGIEISDEDNQQPHGYVVEANTIEGNYWGLYVWNFGSSDLPADSVLRMDDNRVQDNSRGDMRIVAWECPPDDPCDE